MSLSYRVDAARRLVLVSFSGALSPAEIAEVQRRNLELDARGPWRALVDCTRVEHLEGAGKDLRSAADGSTAYVFGRIALVAPTDLAFELARMYQHSTGADAFRVFRDIEQAREWLGIEDE